MIPGIFDIGDFFMELTGTIINHNFMSTTDAYAMMTTKMTVV